MEQIKLIDIEQFNISDIQKQTEEIIDAYKELEEDFINMNNVTDKLDSIQSCYDDSYHSVFYPLIVCNNKQISSIATELNDTFKTFHQEIFELQEYEEKKEINTKNSQHTLYKFNDTNRIIQTIHNTLPILSDLLSKLLLNIEDNK